ncbi:MAG: DNA-directed RNA polymerase subunit P [Candidatus Nanohalarchaeota archaeon]|nr:MAG: DNA-directed RNA polymerase subunit P [Candidatus Nanohaloarchaeota archaeon]
MYVCYECGQEIDIKRITPGLFCPKCSGRILVKLTPPVTKTIKCI